MSDRFDTCICCGGIQAEDHFAGLRRCTGCGHIWADLRLSDDELRALYSADYYQGAEYMDYEREAAALRRNFRRQVKILARRHPRGSRLWEIGSAYGFFLDEASKHFEAAGCDISEHAVQYAREKLGADARAGDFLELDAPGPFDAVCLWDTVEHLREPHRYLAKAWDVLRPGGTLALSTGDIGSAAARRKGARWRLIHPPTHLHYFSAASMRTLLERLEFEDIEIQYLPFWRSADAVAYRILGCPLEKTAARLYRALRAMGLLGFSFPVNTFDLMSVYARKKG